MDSLGRQKAGPGVGNTQARWQPRQRGTCSPQLPRAPWGEGLLPPRRGKAIGSARPSPAPTASPDSQGPGDAAAAGEIIQNRRTKDGSRKHLWPLTAFIVGASPASRPRAPPAGSRLALGPGAESPRSGVAGRRGTLPCCPGSEMNRSRGSSAGRFARPAWPGQTQ